MADEVKPVEPVVVPEVPKTKEEWANLAKNDPGRFAELTQNKIDTIFRQNKEYQEKLTAAEEEKKNLLAEIQRTRQPEPVVVDDGQKYGNGVYPQTEEEWNDLFLERPAFATDLRNEFLSKRTTIQNDFVKTRKDSIKNLVNEHSDMYLCELDAEGKPKRDDKGKVIIKYNQSGEPLFNPDSEKGKMWVDIFNEDPQGWQSNKNAPRLMMLEMESRLRQKGAEMVKGQNNITDAGTLDVAPQGVTPPKTGSLKFASDEEKAHAEKAVGRGTYKSLEDYVKWRDEGTVGYTEPNRRPDFSKK